MQQLEQEIALALNVFKVKHVKHELIKGISVQFMIEDFGVIICGINRTDYKLVDSIIDKSYEGWRKVYITTYDDMTKKKLDILWALMQSGYMEWLRSNVPENAFRNLITRDNLARQIIEQRLKVYNNKPKYKFYIDNNKQLLGSMIDVQYVLSMNPGFFDYMPEEG